MKYNEFKTPEKNSYDISVNVDENYGVVSSNGYFEILTDMIGILDDVSEDDLIESFGITLDEYLNPNEDVISKVKYKLEEKSLAHN